MTTSHDIAVYIIETIRKGLPWNFMTETSREMHIISIEYILGGAY